MAAGREHLTRELHAALWSSAAMPLSGTPLFWWWQLIEECNLYGEYKAIAAFRQGMDPRNPAVRPATPALRFAGSTEGSTSNRVQAAGMSSETNAIGWIYVTAAFGQNVPLEREDDAAARTVSRLQAVLRDFADGVYRVEFVDTTTGQAIKRADVRASDGELVLDVPGFARDIAYRVTPVADGR